MQNLQSEHDFLLTDKKHEVSYRNLASAHNYVVQITKKQVSSMFTKNLEVFSFGSLTSMYNGFLSSLARGMKKSACISCLRKLKKELVKSSALAA